MNKILLGRSTKGIFATREFLKVGDNYINAIPLAGITVEQYLLSDNCFETVISQFEGKTEQKISFDELLPTFQNDTNIWGVGGTHYNSKGEIGNPAPSVLFQRPSSNIVKPYGHIEKLPSNTTSIVPEMELALIFNKEGKVVAYAYAADPTTDEQVSDETKKCIKTSKFPISFAVVQSGTQTFARDVTYSLKGKSFAEQFNCTVGHTGKGKGLCMAEAALIEYLHANGVSGAGVLLTGHPAAEQLSSIAGKINTNLRSGVEQSLLTEEGVAISYKFGI